MYACEGVIPELKGRRIRLREMSAYDAEAMFHCWSDPQTTAFLDLPVMDSAEDAKTLIDWLNALARQDEAIRWGIELIESGGLIGSCGFNFWQLEGAYRGEFGCELASAAWGKGYMTEAAEMVAAFGFQSMELNRVEAFVDPRNERAYRWFKRTGYTCEGIMRDYRHTSKGFVDAAVFSLLRQDWDKARERKET